MKKTAILLMSITLLIKLAGFFREITLSYFYGVSYISDAYIISLTVPLTIFGFVGTAISTGFIPMYSKIDNDNGRVMANRYTTNLINMLIIISGIIILAGVIFAKQIVLIFASGFSGETLQLAIMFTRISLLGIFFFCLIFVSNGFLQINGNYSIPAIAGLVFNLVIILSIYTSTHTNLLVLAIGSVLAPAAQFTLLIPFLRRKGYRHGMILDPHDKHVRNMIQLALPVIVGSSVNQINVLVDKTIASQIAVGGISALNYASRLNNFVQGIFVLSIATAMYPMISSMATQNNIAGLKKSLTEAVSTVSLIVIPAAVGAMLFAEPVVRLLFGRGAFDEKAISMTAYALFYFSIGMIGFGLRDIVSKVFYSLQDTKTPMTNAAISMVMNIILSIVLSRFIGIGGLALATSLSAIFCTLLLFISLRKKIGPFGMTALAVTLAKVVAASTIMGIAAKLSFDYISRYISANMSIIIAIGIGAMIYLMMVFLLKVEEVHTIMGSVVYRIRNAKSRVMG